MNDTLKRPTRTAVQGGVSYAVVDFVDAFNIITMDDRQFGVSVILLTIVLSWLQVLVENYFMKGFLRTPEDE